MAPGFPPTLILERKLSQEDALGIASRQPAVCITDARIDNVIKQKGNNLEAKLREHYAPLLGQTPSVPVRFPSTLSRTCESREVRTPTLFYHPFGWQELSHAGQSQYRFADLFLNPNQPMLARKATHYELDGFTALVPSEDGISSSPLAYNMSLALSTKSGFTNATDPNSKPRDPTTTQGWDKFVLYPIWEVPVIETYKASFPVQVTDSSQTHKRTLELQCDVLYEAIGAIFVDAVSGSVYYTKPSHAYFDRNNPSSAQAKFTFSLKDSKYEGFRFLTEEEAMEKARNSKELQGIKPLENHSYKDLILGILNCSMVGGILGGFIGGYLYITDVSRGYKVGNLEDWLKQGALIGGLLPTILTTIFVYADYYRRRSEYYCGKTEQLITDPVSLGLCIDPYGSELKRQFDLNL